MNKDELIDYCKEASQTISELDYKNRILEKENQELKKKYENTVEKLSEQLELLTSKLDEYDLITDERNQLKKQLEEKKMLIKQCDLSISKVMDCYCERTDCSGRIKDSKQYDSLVQKVETQQKEFIKYLEDKIYSIEPKGTDINYNCEYDSEEDYVMAMQEQSKLNTLKEILQKYKSIIGE
jgi:predicted RNase H-like nuclease (RuvC/YqgF family)|uniref:Uncharacterized protein n=1 Tax=Siphoviridae sp. ctMYJ33 TaxID=2825461 RepID=A0A8S5P9C4_9CAUD|nr:MAG TPA: hypothetical protein [Siphoviridae sp. ctMYJ33]